MAAAAIATAATIAMAPSAHAVFGPCDGYHDVEVHIASGQCVQANYPR